MNKYLEKIAELDTPIYAVSAPQYTDKQKTDYASAHKKQKVSAGVTLGAAAATLGGMHVHERLHGMGKRMGKLGTGLAIAGTATAVGGSIAASIYSQKKKEIRRNPALPSFKFAAGKYDKEKLNQAYATAGKNPRQIVTVKK